VSLPFYQYWQVGSHRAAAKWLPSLGEEYQTSSVFVAPLEVTVREKEDRGKEGEKGKGGEERKEEGEGRQ